MAKNLDFNSVQRPTLVLTMKDAEKTKIRVSTPTEALIEEMQAVTAELGEVAKTGDGASIKAVFDLAARLICCNRDGIRVTAEQLRDDYNINLEDLVIFFSAYIDFVEEISRAKN